MDEVKGNGVQDVWFEDVRRWMGLMGVVWGVVAAGGEVRWGWFVRETRNSRYLTYRVPGDHRWGPAGSGLPSCGLYSWCGLHSPEGVNARVFAD